MTSTTLGTIGGLCRRTQFAAGKRNQEHQNRGGEAFHALPLSSANHTNASSRGGREGAFGASRRPHQSAHRFFLQRLADIITAH
jgi:hypothetical protein